MTLKDEFVTVIEQARREERRRRRETLPDAEWWAEIRDIEIVPVLAQAVEAFNETGIDGKLDKKNGGSGTALRAGYSTPLSHLTFTHVENSIVVESSIGALAETWDNRPFVGAEAVVAKVRDFAAAVAAIYLTPRPRSAGLVTNVPAVGAY